MEGRPGRPDDVQPFRRGRVSHLIAVPARPGQERLQSLLARGMVHATITPLRASHELETLPRILDAEH
jgi:hypothetical protein